ncbi:MAG TPA: hypothetical protein PLH57_07365 [Oligoflexia bacterium]|nr:hypothetical protein [Oligoflexia bacterium]
MVSFYIWTLVCVLSSVAWAELPESNPFQNTAQWVNRIDSTVTPISVYYASDTVPENSVQENGESVRETAQRTLSLLETAWDLSAKMGFAKPVAYNPIDPNRFAGFLVAGNEMGVEAGNPLEIDGGFLIWPSYMSIAPWGIYAGERFASTIVHEFHHAVQAVYDWEEPGSIYEMSSNYVQELFFPGENADAAIEIADFQARPEWAPHYYDDYKTYFMYGSWLYLKFLELRYFEGKADFLVKLWEATAPIPGDRNPIWVEAIETLLPKGVTYADSIAAFARWRTWLEPQARKDARRIGKSVLQSQVVPPPRIHYRFAVTGRRQSLESAGMQLFGSHYIELQCKTSCKGAQVLVEFLNSDAAQTVYWKMQRINQTKSSAIVVVTPLPKKSAFDIANDSLIPYRITVR